MKSLYWINCIKLENNLSLSIKENRVIGFFICENTDNEKLIKQIALSLAKAGCEEVFFYGSKENVWHLIFDTIAGEANFQFDILTTGYENKDDFIFSLEMETRCNNRDRSLYLFYDDETLFKSVLWNLIGKDRPCPLMDGEDIISDHCYEYSMVAERMFKPDRILPEKAKAKPHFRDICLACKYHDID